MGRNETLARAGPGLAFHFGDGYCWIMNMRAFLMFLLLALTACTGLPLKEPKAELKDVYIKDVGLRGGTLMFVLDVQNPNTSDITIDEVSYETFLDGAFFAKAKTDKPLTVGPEATSKVELPLPIEFTKLAGGIGKALTGEPVDYRIKGTAKISIFSIPFDEKGKFEIKR